MRVGRERDKSVLIPQVMIQGQRSSLASGDTILIFCWPCVLALAFGVGAYGPMLSQVKPRNSHFRRVFLYAHGGISPPLAAPRYLALPDLPPFYAPPTVRESTVPGRLRQERERCALQQPHTGLRTQRVSDNSVSYAVGRCCTRFARPR